jgi:CysZ protein
MFVKVPLFFLKSFSLLKSDRKILLYSFIPVILGVILYYFLGSYVFTDLYAMGTGWIKSKVEVGDWIGDAVIWILGVFFLLFMNFTFFIFVSIFASPFNDLISSRVEEVYLGKSEDNEPFAHMLKKIPTILKNEFKKISLIIFLSIINLVIGLFFPPASFVIGGMLFAISFVDYSWSRNELDFSSCVGDLKKGFLAYLLGGIGFMFLISIPILNLLFLPIAVIFFTIIFCELKLKNA